MQSLYTAIYQAYFHFYQAHSNWSVSVICPKKTKINLCLSMCCHLNGSIWNYTDGSIWNNGLTWEGSFGNEKVLFSKWIWVFFLKKLFGNTCFSYRQKENFRGAQFFSKFSKIGMFGAHKWFYGVKYDGYVCH